MKLKINRSDLTEALTSNFQFMEGAWYLDSESGEIILASDAVDDLPEDLETNPRYLCIDPIDSHKSFRIMENFVETLGYDKAADRLAGALSGPKPFRKFKDVLLDFPTLREEWFAFEYAANSRMAEQWCEEHDIDPEWI